MLVRRCDLFLIEVFGCTEVRKEKLLVTIQDKTKETRSRNVSKVVMLVKKCLKILVLRIGKHC